MNRNLIPYYVSRALLSAVFGWFFSINLGLWIGILIGVAIYAYFLWQAHSGRYLVDPSSPLFPFRRDNRSRVIRDKAVVVSVAIAGVIFFVASIAASFLPIGNQVGLIALVIGVVIYFVASRQTTKSPKMTKRIWFLTWLIMTMLTMSACDTFAPASQITPTPASESQSTVTGKAEPPVPSEPNIEIQPESTLADELVQIRVTDLESGQTVTLTAVMNDDRSREWESQATFVADGRGVVDVTTQAPVSGTYKGLIPWG